jgi:hypothetical protein
MKQKQRALPGDRQSIDLQLVTKFRNLVDQGVSLPDIIAQAGQVDSQKLSATLEHQRRALALAVFQSAAANIKKLTDEYYLLLDKVLAELKSRDPKAMSTRDLIEAGRLMSQWLLKIQSEVAMPTPPKTTAPVDQPATMQMVQILIQQAHAMKERSETEQTATFSILPGIEEVDAQPVA